MDDKYMEDEFVKQILELLKAYCNEYIFCIKKWNNLGLYTLSMVLSKNARNLKTIMEKSKIQ